jgi:Skp family chaperone for outer membrane proteins
MNNRIPVILLFSFTVSASAFAATESASAPPVEIAQLQPAAPGPDAVQVLLEQARSMIADPAKHEQEDWLAISKKLEEALPGVVHQHQRLQGDLNNARTAARKDEAIVSLLRQREQLDQTIRETIETLPAVKELKTQIEQSHKSIMDTSKMRVQVQRFIRHEDAPSQEIPSETATPEGSAQ